MLNIKKKVMMAATTTALGAMLIGAGTFAYFNDTVQSTGNTFNTGTIDISTSSDVTTSKFNVSNKKPGDTFTGTYTIKNTGSLAAGLTAKITYTPQATDIGTQLKIDSIKFNGSDVTLPANTDKDNNGVTMDELNNVLITLTDLNPNMTTGQDLVISGTFTETNQPQNSYQGLKLGGDSGATITFEAKQK